MKERLYRTLNIKFSESSQVFDLLTVQFFIGLANALVNIIAYTLFIYNFPINTLPLVYVVIAVVLLILNFIYEKLEHLFSPLQLLRYVIGFAITLLIALWIGLANGNQNVFIFILIVSSVLIYMVTGYAFWGLVSLLFNVRESRRVFSIVGSGDIPAKLIGYIAAPLLIPVVGLNNLVWLAILSLITGLLLFSKFIRKKSWDGIKNKSHGEQHHIETVTTKHDFISFFFKNKLIFAISLLSLLSYNVFVLIDYTFISQVKLRFENISELAAYIAVFFAFGRLIALFFKLIFTSRVIERVGVISSLFITPVALFLFCLLFFNYGNDSSSTLFIFGLMAMLTEVLRSTIQEPVFFILFQPLKENLRLKGHMISKGYMYPPSLIIVGLSLLFMYKTDTPITILLAIKVIIINLCIWAAIIYFIRRSYLNTIHASIKKGIYSSDEIYINDQRTINILLNKIASGEKMEVIYALNLLEKSGYPGLQGLLANQLTEGKDVAVKKYALDRIELTGDVSNDVLKTMLDTHDTELKQKVVSLLCKNDPTFIQEASLNIHAYEYSIRKIIIINLLNQREFNYLFKAGNEINNLLISDNHIERELAVEIISELKHVQFSDAIATLILDKEASVKRMAIQTACKLRMKPLLPPIIELLNHPADKNIVLKGLQIYGDELFDDICSLPGDSCKQHLYDFIKLAARVKGSYSTAFLLSKLSSDNFTLQDKTVHALWVKEYEPSGPAEEAVFSNLLNNYLKNGHEKLADYRHIPDFTDKEIIHRSIYNEIKNDLSIALKICVLLFRKKEINRILELMEIDKHDKIYNAMEMLELVLPKKISKELNQLFDFILDPLHNGTASSMRDIVLFYNKAIFNAPHVYNPWTKAVCVYSSWKNNEHTFLQKLKGQVTTDEHFLVTETREYVLNSIK